MRTVHTSVAAILVFVVSCLSPFPASGDTAIWTGSGGDGLWSNGNNWSTTPNPPAAGDTASFTNAGAGTVNLGGATQTVAGAAFTNAAGSPFTLQNGTLAVGSLTRSGTGDAILRTQITAPNLAATISGGLLQVTDTTNATTGGAWTVSGGTLAAVGVVGSTALGSAGVTLSGGTLELQVGPFGAVSGLSESIFNGVPYNAQDNIEGYRGATLGASDAKGTLIGHLHYNDDGAVSSRAATLGAVGFDNGDFSMLWVGDFTPTENGSWGFRFNHVDDNASIWVDFDRNGVFSQSGSNGNERIYSRGCCAGSGDVYTLTNLTAGTTYKVGIVMSDTGGGGDFRDMEVKSPSGSWIDLNPSALGGLFQTQALPAWAGTNAVTVTANSAIRIGANVPEASLGSLSMGPDTTLTVDSASKQTLTITGATTLNGGTATFNTINQSVLVLNTVGETAASNLTATGNGTLRLAAANTYTGVTTIAPGATIELGNSAALGDEAGKTVIQSGGTLDIKGLRVGANGNELVEVQGTGVGGAGAIKNTGGGQTSAFRQITMTGDATFRADNRWDIRNTGGAATFDMGGFTLTKVGGSEFCLVSTSIVNPGSVNVNQGTFRVEGSSVYGGSGTIAVAGGTTLDFYGTSATHTPTITLANGANLSANGGGGPTLSGPVAITGTANVITNNNITLSGQVSGGTIRKTGGNTLFLTNPANSFTGLTMAGGRVRTVGSTAPMGQVAGITLPRNTTLEFDGTMPVGGANLNTITFAGGTLGAYNGTATVNSTLAAEPDVDINFEGSGNFVINQSLGYSGPVPLNAFRHYGFNRSDDNALMDLNNNGGMLNNLNPPAVSGFYGKTLLTTGPGGRGLNFDNDADFQNTGAVTNGDNYSNLFLGTLRVSPALAGTWSFQFQERDDPCGIWIDLDRDGAFESTVAGLGSDRGEQLSWNDYRVPKNVTLAAGDYMIAFTHREGGGGSQIDAQYKAPGMAGFVTIQPTLASQDGLFTIVPTGGLNKAGTGTLTLNAANTFNGPTTVGGGTIIAANSLAFGQAGGGIVMGSRTSVALTNNVTIAGENITGADGQDAGRSGTLVNLSGSNAFLGNISAARESGQQAVSIVSDSGTLTVGASGGGNTIALNASKLTLGGAGDVVIHSDISGASAPYYGDGLRHYGSHVNNDGLVMDLNANAGMYNQGNPSAFAYLYGQAMLTSGPGNRGLDFNDDNDFINTGAIGQVDNYSNLFIGYLQVDAAKAGAWNLRINQQDDPTGIWIDLDRDGVFESTTAGLGSDRGEQLLWSTVGTRTVNLAAGEYLVAFTHREGGGGSGIEAQFQAPGMSALTMIKPSDPAQAGIWRTLFTPTNDLTKIGSGTTTLAGNNSYAGLTRVQQGTLIAAHNNALGTTAAGTVVSDGATLGLRNNVTISGEGLTIGEIGGSGRGGLRNIADTNTWVGDVNVAPRNGGQAGIGSDAGTLTVQGGVNLAYSKLIVNGAGDTVITGAITGLGSGEHFVAGGLTGRYYNLVTNGVPNDEPSRNALIQPNGNVIGMDALTPQVIQLTPRIDFGSGTETFAGDGSVLDRGGTNGNPYGGIGVNLGVDQIAGLWTGHIQIAEDGSYRFTTRSDDGSRVWVDLDRNGTFEAGELVADLPTHGGMRNDSRGTFTLAAGIYAIKAATYEGGGGAGMQVSWEKTAGSNTFARRIIGPDVLGERFLADNSLIKQGAGTLSLNGTNTYDGQTIIEQGRLNVNGSIVSPTIVQAGGVLGGTGIVLNTVSGDGLVSPGVSPGTLTVTNLDPTGGLDFGFEYTQAGLTPPAGANDVLAMGSLLASLTGTNAVGVYFNLPQVNWGDQFLGGFSMAGLDLSMIAQADWEFFVAGDGQGPVDFEGNRYYPLTDYYGLDWRVEMGIRDGMLQLGVEAPEPATLALLALAAGGLGGYIRRRRAA